MLDKEEIEKIPYIDNLPGLNGGFQIGNVKEKEKREGNGKLVKDIEEAINLCGLRDGMTISFHHHFRNGDKVVGMVLAKLDELGFKGLTLSASSLTGSQDEMIKYIENGLITRIESTGLHGRLGEEVSNGIMDIPVIFRSHGGRAYAIEKGELEIDIAFLGAPSSDKYGNANGYVSNSENGLMCGSLGYAMMDAMYSKHTIIITNNIVDYPNIPYMIPENHVDYVVDSKEEIGDPKGIMSGTTRAIFNPLETLIAGKVADIIEIAGYLENGFAMQMGSGGASLAVAGYIREKMILKGIYASFALGGITGVVADMHEEGLIRKLLDVQSFDLKASTSLKNNSSHQPISASYYASPSNRGSAVDKLSFVVLSALEIDVNFNVNVLTGSDGVIRGAIGGHADTASGASLTVIASPLVRGRIPCVVEKVLTVVTPGKTVDILVTEQGIAVNPSRKDLIERLTSAGVKIEDIEVLRQRAEKITGVPKKINFKEKIIGIVNYRDNSIIDIVRQV